MSDITSYVHVKYEENGGCRLYIGFRQKGTLELFDSLSQHTASNLELPVFKLTNHIAAVLGLQLFRKHLLHEL